MISVFAGCLANHDRAHSLSCQELIKKKVGGKKMKVSDLVKKLTVIPKFNEDDDHLNAHAQRNGGGSRKKQLDSIVSVKQFTNKTQKPRNAIDAVLILCLTKQNTNGVTIVICQRFQASWIYLTVLTKSSMRKNVLSRRKYLPKTRQASRRRKLVSHMAKSGKRKKRL